MTLGESPVRLRCAVKGAMPVPHRLPQVVWRRELDLAPVDITDPAAVRRLEAWVWVDQPERLERLRAAIALARDTPPMVERGEAVADRARLAAEAPPDATLVIFHSALVAYLDAAERDVFTRLVRDTGAVWLANEATGVLHAAPPVRPSGACFVLSRNDEVLAVTHPHGRWIEWTQGKEPGAAIAG